MKTLAVLGAALAASTLTAQASLGAQPETASQSVTIFARPTVVGWAQGATLYGTAEGARAQDIVTIQVRECGSGFFRTYVEAHANAGGGWLAPVGTAITSTFRAVWRETSSSHVTIRQRANVLLERRRSGTGFTVAVSAKRSFWRKKVQIQRRQGGSWRTVKTVLLSDSVSSSGVVSFSRATFRLPLPKGALLRALLPSSQAKPCYVSSVSRTVRT
ncbi:hypothetical protein BH09ACT13_BH09ACT13_03540 [soil metagenome]